MVDLENTEAVNRSFDDGVVRSAPMEDFAETIDMLFKQLHFPPQGLDVIDRVIELCNDDVLVCDINFLEYAMHALSIEKHPKELWLTLPAENPFFFFSREDVEAAVPWLEYRCNAIRELLESSYPTFMGFTTSVPANCFKQVRCFSESQWDHPLDLLASDKLWDAVASKQCSIGAIASVLDEEYGAYASENLVLKGLSNAVSLPDGAIVLTFDESSMLCRMEDLSDSQTLWSCDITPVEIAVNGGCLVPAIYHEHFIEARQTSLGALASRISRGTTLTGNYLQTLGKKRKKPLAVEMRPEEEDFGEVNSCDVKDHDNQSMPRIGDRAHSVRLSPINHVNSDGSELILTCAPDEVATAEAWGTNEFYRHPKGMVVYTGADSSRLFAMSLKVFLENSQPISKSTECSQSDNLIFSKTDCFYIDSACIDRGRISPIELESIPEGQSRYVVMPEENEVLLISRNGKQLAFYEASRPTLIANSVFVVRFHNNVDREYLRCWLQGSFARAWIDNQGQMLSKGTLASLPVPILDDKARDLIVEYNEMISKSILDYQDQISWLEELDRFDLIKAMRAVASRTAES